MKGLGNGIAEKQGDGYVLNGTKLFVPYANSAKHLLVVGRTGSGDSENGITLFMVDAKSDGIDIEEMPTAARDMKCAVQFKDVSVSKNNILGEVDNGWQIVDHLLQYGGVLKAAEMSGGTQAALDLAVKYSKERHQFGKPIGSFQALQHRMVQMLTEVDGLKFMVYEAAFNINDGISDKMLNSMAKIKANKAYHRVCFDASNIFGAIGWTEEMDISLYLLRTKANENDGGPTSIHEEIVAMELDNYEPEYLSML